MAEKKERTREKELANVEKEKRLNKLKEQVLDHHHVVKLRDMCSWNVRYLEYCTLVKLFKSIADIHICR